MTSIQPDPDTAIAERLRRAVQIVAILNAVYFGVEFFGAITIRSVSLFADSIDFLEDASVNSLILIALRWSVQQRARVGVALAGILLIPGLAALWIAVWKLAVPVPPDPIPLSIVGGGALVVNLCCVVILVRFRHHTGSLTRAAFLSARNDAIANVAIMAAGFATLYYYSVWPDLAVGIGIAVINVDAAKQVYRVAREELRTAC